MLLPLRQSRFILECYLFWLLVVGELAPGSALSELTSITVSEILLFKATKSPELCLNSFCIKCLTSHYFIRTCTDSHHLLCKISQKKAFKVLL